MAVSLLLIIQVIYRSKLALNIERDDKSALILCIIFAIKALTYDEINDSINTGDVISAFRCYVLFAAVILPT